MSSFTLPVKSSPPPRATSALGGKVLLLSVLAVLTFGGCQSEEPQTGSQTNWLKGCGSSDDCGDLDCVCGTCTVTCAEADACGDFKSGECVPIEDGGAVALCNGVTPQMPLCLQRCEDAPCPNGASCIAGVCSPSRDPSVRVSVNPSATEQTLIGFGASIAYDGDAIIAHPRKAEIYDAMFVDSGLDIVRVRSRWNGDNPGELAAAAEIIAEAEARMGKLPLVVLASSSPPPNLKANGVKFCPQSDPNCTLSRDASGGFDYAGFAEYWRSALVAYEDQGVVPDFVSIQNNADWIPGAPEGGETCRFLPEEGTDTVTLADGTTVDAEFPGYNAALEAVHAAVDSLGRSYAFIAPETGSLPPLPPYTDVLSTDSYDIIGYHLFGNSPPNIPFDELEALKAFSEDTGLPHMQTEMGADGLGTAILVHHTFVTAGGSAYIQDQFVSRGLDLNSGAPLGTDAESFQVQPAYHALAHFARGTDPGWLLAEATNDSDNVLASVWVSPGGTDLTIVLVNPTDNYSDVEVTAPTEWESALLEATVTRTVFNGVERSADLGSLPTDGVLRIPGRSVVTIAATN